LFCYEGPAKGCPHAQDLEEAGQDQGTRDLLGVAVLGQRMVPTTEPGDSLERAAFLPDVDQIGEADGELRLRRPPVAAPDEEGSARVRVGKRADQNAVHDTEDCSGGADTERESEYRRSGEPWSTAETAQRVSDIPSKLIE